MFKYQIDATQYAAKLVFLKLANKMNHGSIM